MKTAQAPGKSLFMTAFMMYLCGNTIQIFSIMIVGMALYTPIKALFSIGARKSTHIYIIHTVYLQYTRYHNIIIWIFGILRYNDERKIGKLHAIRNEPMVYIIIIYLHVIYIYIYRVCVCVLQNLKGLRSRTLISRSPNYVSLRYS